AQAATGLGPAQDYNLFILGDANNTNTDSQGRVAVGGNATFSSYSVASSLSSPAANALVVGGSVSYTNGTVSGDLHYGTTKSLSGVNVTGTTTNDTPINFNTAATQLTALSNSLSQLGSNGTVTQGNLGLTLTGTSSTQNVFNLTAAQFASANSNGLNIVSPNGSTVIINVAGTSASLANFQMYVNGSSSEANSQINNILFNFKEATSITNSNVAIYGSVLAPNADLNFGYSHIDGTLIGKSLTDSHVETHNYPFGGNVVVPEPSSIALASILGLGGLVHG
ncbi:choice-of-anchor A family protein, partial [Singulisphaera rosea]